MITMMILVRWDCSERGTRHAELGAENPPNSNNPIYQRQEEVVEDILLTA